MPSTILTFTSYLHLFKKYNCTLGHEQHFGRRTLNKLPESFTEHEEGHDGRVISEVYHSQQVGFIRYLNHR